MRNNQNSKTTKCRESLFLKIGIVLLSTIFMNFLSVLDASGQNDSNPYRASTLKKKVFPEKVNLSVGEIHNIRNILHPDDHSTKLVYPIGGEKPYLILDIGPASVGGYPVFKVTSKSGTPILRIAYACWYPYLVDPEFGEQGDFTRRYENTYLGFDLPVLPGNPGRFELYSINRTGEFMHPLIQGQERWVRIQLETEGTSVELDYFYIQNVHDFSPLDGEFFCSDDDLNRLWNASVYTAQFASIDNSNPLDIVNGWCAARKLTYSNEVILAQKGKEWSDYTFSLDMEIRRNPLHTSGAGWAFRARDPDNCYTGLIKLNNEFIVSKRIHGESIVLQKKVLPFVVQDGTIYQINTILRKNEISIFIDGQLISKFRDNTFKSGTIGFFQPLEHWAIFDEVIVKSIPGEILFSDNFDTDLSQWDFYRAPPFLCDGSLRDRLPWIGDLDWAGYNVYYGFKDAKFMKGSLEIFALHQNPEGYIWPTAFPEDTVPPESGNFGYWPSDEYSAWFVPVLGNYLLYTGDIQTAKRLYPSAKKDLNYLIGYMGDDDLFDQREETKRGQGDGGDFGGFSSKKFAYMNILLYYAIQQGAYLAQELNISEDKIYFETKAEQLKKAIFSNFWDENKGYFVLSPSERKFHYKSNGLALAIGLVNDQQAATMIVSLNNNLSYSYGSTIDIKEKNIQDVGKLLLEKYGFISGKFLSHSISGRFLYAADSSALESIRKSTWIKIMNDWRGVQDATWESTIYPPFRPAGDGYRDMSHADNACAHLMSGYILGIKPVQTGYRKFEAIPHPAGLQWAKGRVPTPYGTIEMAWDFNIDGISIYASKVSIPEKTSCKLGIPIAYFKEPFKITINDQVIYDGEKTVSSAFGIVSLEKNYLYVDELQNGNYKIVVFNKK